MYSLARFSLLEMTECSGRPAPAGRTVAVLQEAASKAVNYLSTRSATRPRGNAIVSCPVLQNHFLQPAGCRTSQLVREKLGGIAPFPDYAVSHRGPQPARSRIGIESIVLTDIVSYRWSAPIS